MKKTSSILMIVALVVPFLGAYVFFQANKIKVRKEIKEKIISGLDKDELVLLSFTEEEASALLEWEHPGEFEYQGQMYDIVEAGAHGDTVWYRCYEDHKETRINKAIEQAVAKAAGHDPSRKDQTERLTDFFKTLFLQDVKTWKAADINTLSLQFSTFNLHYSSPSFSPPSPPPKVV